MRKSFRCRALPLAVLGFTSALAAQTAASAPQKIKSYDLGVVRSMLASARDDVKKHYYDPTYHGVDVDARFREYDARLASAPSMNEGLRTIAAFLEGFKDSHTFFLPPPRPYTFEPGYQMKIIGNQCFITRVRPKTDAFEKLHPGDKIVKFNSYSINRGDFEDIGYYFNLLNPAPVYELDIETPDGKQSHVSIKATTRPGKKTIDLSEMGNDYWDLVRRGENQDELTRSIVTTVGDTAYWKMPEFNLSPEQVDVEFGKVRNKSGLVAKPRGSHAFTGKLVVLVDSQSASCSELFARVMQLEHRGTIVGDLTAGAVMESIHYGEETGADYKTFFGFSITDADLQMGDGKSLEKVGVTPDQPMRPTGRALAAGADPILVQAAELAGGKLTLEQANKLFPYEWKPL